MQAPVQQRQAYHMALARHVLAPVLVRYIEMFYCISCSSSLMIFDYNLITQHRLQAFKNQQKFNEVSYIYNTGSIILSDILEIIESHYIQNILIIGERGILIDNLLKKYHLTTCNITKCNNIAELNYVPQNIDLIMPKS